MITKKFEEFKKIYENNNYNKIELNTNLLPFLSVDSYQSGPIFFLSEQFEDMETEREDFEILFNKELDLFVSPDLVAETYLNYMNKKSNDIIECIGLESIEDIEMSDFLSPKSYNFKRDSALVKLKVKDNFIEDILLKITNDEIFIDYLEENFKSRSGFISHTAWQLEDFLPKLKNRNEQEIGAAISYIVDGECIEDISDKVIDEIMSSFTYEEFLNEESKKEYYERISIKDKLIERAKELRGEEDIEEELYKYFKKINTTDLNVEEDWDAIGNKIIDMSIGKKNNLL